MTFRVDYDRMHLVWQGGCQDVAHACLEEKGLEVARGSSKDGASAIYRCTEGWERRIRYKSPTRDSDRARSKLRMRKKAEDARE